jgi:hypothetical protein
MREYEAKPYEYWQSLSFPLAFEREFDSYVIQFTISMLESTPEYVHIGFSADGGGLSAYLPVGSDIIVKKTNSTPCTGEYGVR